MTTVFKQKSIDEIIFTLGIIRAKRWVRDEKEDYVDYTAQLVTRAGDGNIWFLLSWHTGNLIEIRRGVDPRVDAIAVIPMNSTVNFDGTTIRSIATMIYGIMLGYASISEDIEEV